MIGGICSSLSFYVALSFPSLFSISQSPGASVSLITETFHVNGRLCIVRTKGQAASEEVLDRGMNWAQRLGWVELQVQASLPGQRLHSNLWGSFRDWEQGNTRTQQLHFTATHWKAPVVIDLGFHVSKLTQWVSSLLCSQGSGAAKCESVYLSLNFSLLNKCCDMHQLKASSCTNPVKMVLDCRGTVETTRSQTYGAALCRRTAKFLCRQIMIKVSGWETN